MMIVLKVSWNKAVVLKYNLNTKILHAELHFACIVKYKLISKVSFHSKDIGSFNVCLTIVIALQNFCGIKKLLQLFIFSSFSVIKLILK